MSVNKDASGRRSVQVEIEVPGTPEEVWQAIATGPGISSWFVPSTVEERVGGRATANFGPGMESLSTVTEWDPPRKFVADSQDLGPNAPTIATEWIVEARSGGTCVVRVVHSLFASSDDWDNQLKGSEGGWPWFFAVLRLYLTHFRGRSCTTFRVMGAAPEPEPKAWAALTGALGLAGATLGQHSKATAGVPPFAGLVERLDERENSHGLLLRLDEPGPGIASLFAMPLGGQVLLVVDFYLYGDRAAALVARDQPRWQSWLQEHFPSAGDASPVA
jgi:uncharacterized protein YndB with AHSA1/START domain